MHTNKVQPTYDDLGQPLGNGMELKYRGGNGTEQVPIRNTIIFGESGLAGVTTELRTLGLQPVGTQQFAIEPDTANQLWISSDDEDDVKGGDGGYRIYIEGIDQFWAPVDEILFLDEQTAVQTVESYMRINWLEVISAGPLGHNKGNIYLTVSEARTDGVPTGNDIIANIAATVGYMTNFTFSKPIGTVFEYGFANIYSTFTSAKAGLIQEYYNIGSTADLNNHNNFWSISNHSVNFGMDLAQARPYVTFSVRTKTLGGTAELTLSYSIALWTPA